MNQQHIGGNKPNLGQQPSKRGLGGIGSNIMASGGLGKAGASSITSMPNQTNNAGSQIAIPVIKPS